MSNAEIIQKILEHFSFGIALWWIGRFSGWIVSIILRIFEAPKD